MLPNADPRKARTPYRRQAFTQMPQPSKNTLRELNRNRPKRVTGPASEVRYGIRKDGVDYMLPTASERDLIRKQELANEALERKQRTADMVEKFNKQMAEIDTWASHH